VKGRTTLGSGATTVFDKGDVSTDILRIECKTTNKKSFTLKKEIFDKIEKEAGLYCQIPLMEVEIQSEQYMIIKRKDFFAIVKPEFVSEEL
jgi:hypothetical protein